MKKIILSLVTMLIMIIGVATVAKATTSSTLADEIYSIGSKYGMTAANKVTIERYLSDHPVTDAEANQILAKAREVAKIYDKAGVKKFSELSESDKEKVKSIAISAGNIVNLSVKYKADEVEIYKNGKLVEVGRYNGDKLIYTGNNTNMTLVVSSVVGVGVALIAVLALRKRIINA